MAQKILSVDSGSPAQRAGILAGDEILSVSGQVIHDLLDYQDLTSGRDIELILRREGRTFPCRIRKKEYAPLGLNFSQPLMSGLRLCCNHCLFCFVDQLPPNVRPTMRVKDDDWRLSLMTGSYVTLTNVADPEIERIIARHASPLYISVHAADPELRSRILGTPRGARLPDQLRRLSDGGIEFHTQAVLCPGINDGDVLEDTIRSLLDYEGTLSLALVPVGLTGWREGLTPLKPYTREEAQEVIRRAEAWQEECLRIRGTRFVFPADEFYLIAGMDPPPDEAYEDYGQIDDGVGMLRLLETEYHEAWLDLEESEKDPQAPKVRDFIIACGVSAAPFLSGLMEAHPLTGISIRVIPVENRFFGPTVTVSGLVTGGDLIRELRDEPGDCIFITECMLRNERDRYLDDMTTEEVCRQIGRPVIPVGRRGDELLDAFMDARKSWEDHQKNG